MDAFLWPWVLLSLLFIPVLIYLYRRLLKQSGKVILFFPYLSLVARASSKRTWKQHIPAFLYLTAILFLVVALARPMLEIPQIDPRSSIILALDISRSMRTEDIEPNRFEAARAAIHTFVRDLPDDTRVGLIAFADSAVQVSPITDDHESLLKAVDLLTMGYGTAIGDAMLKSLASFPTLEEREALGEPEKLATIILLSDGRNQMGVSPVEAVKELSAQRVTVHTIGVGNPNAELPLGSQGFAGLNEEDLRMIAHETGGQFVFADSAKELNNVYKNLKKTLMWTFGRDEVTAVAVLGAAFLLFLSLAFAQLRRRVL
jgi:Ca-activated chloride channel homolog